MDFEASSLLFALCGVAIHFLGRRFVGVIGEAVSLHNLLHPPKMLPFRRAEAFEVGEVLDEYEAYRMSWSVQDWLMLTGHVIRRVSSPWLVSKNCRFLVAGVDLAPARIVIVDLEQKIMTFCSMELQEFESYYCQEDLVRANGLVMSAHDLEMQLLEMSAKLLRNVRLD